MPLRHPFNTRALTVLGVLLSAATTPAQTNQDARFPFVMPWDDASKTVVDVSALNPAPLTDKHRVEVRNGHFYDATGRRVRFLGTNFGSSANFPFKLDAEKVAARLRKLGFNIVRLHHMDAPWSNPNIFGKDRNNAELPNQEISAESLDLLDYLIYQLKLNGIYVDLNLHVSWTPNAAEGFPDANKLPELGKTTAYFEKKSIEWQKKYARDLLTHVNPYTKLSYADDPAVALIEINNEDTILGHAWTDTLINLPPYYRDQLAEGWNAFLKEKYTSTDNMRRTWTGGAEPGMNLLRNARFENEANEWQLERQQGEFEMSVEDLVDVAALPADARPQGRAVHFKVTQLGDAAWKQQFHQTGLDFTDGETYTVEFWAKADKERNLPVYAAYDRDPWSQVGTMGSVALTPQWKRYRLMFGAKNPLPEHNRLSFTLGETTGEVWLADVSLRRGFILDFEPGQTLEAGNLPLTRANATPQGKDFIAYILEVERKYAEGMRDYIKNTLKAKGLVACSQANFGGLGGVIRESRMDWVDTHAYWQHPTFPRAPWDPKDWTIPNTPMVREAGGGTFSGLAMHRVEGKPFTVSEYNHPAPNDYAAETMPLLAAYAAWQDWDGIFLFSYSGSRDTWKDDRIRNYFDADSDPNKMALMPAAAAIFLGGLIEPVQAKQTTLVVPRDSATDILGRVGLTGFWSSNLPDFWNGENRDRRKMTRRDALESRMGVRLVDGRGPVQLERTLGLSQTKNQFDWHTDSPETALLTVDAPAAKAAVGFLGGQWVALGNTVVTMEPTERNFAVLTLTAMDRKTVERSSSLLLTAVGNFVNTGMGWNADRTSIGDQWGSGPTLANGIPATVTFKTQATRATVYALDGTGKRLKTVPSQLAQGQLSFHIGPEHQTVWYEIESTPPR